MLACGDDGAAGEETGSGTGAEGTTLPLPSATETGSADATAATDDPGTTADETGLEPDLPPTTPATCDALEELVATLPGLGPDEQFATIGGFVSEVLYDQHGWPGVDANTLCVVYVDLPGRDVSLAGDFNEWDPSTHPLTEIPSTGLYWGSFETASPPEGLYKVVLDGEEYVADPLARRFGWDEFGEYSLVDPLPDRSHHERWPGFDQGAGSLAARTVTAYVPAGALELSELPVLYMHDGQNLFDPDAFFGGWRVSETLDVAIGDGTLAPMVVVGIDNTPARFDEYTPVTDDLGDGPVGGDADLYADFLVDGIKPFIEERYPVSSDPARVGVMGSSLGGLVSLSIGLRHPDVFGQVASMSGTIDWGTFGLSNPTIDELYAADAPMGLRIYVDSGGSEGLGCPDGDTDNYCGNVRLANTLRELGWADEVDLFYRWDPGAPHNEAAWASRFLDALIDWFPQ